MGGCAPSRPHQEADVHGGEPKPCSSRREQLNSAQPRGPGPPQAAAAPVLTSAAAAVTAQAVAAEGSACAPGSPSCAPCSPCSPDSAYGVPAKDEAQVWSEAERLEALRALGVLHAADGPRFGPITSILKLLFEVPLANVFLLDEHEVVEVPDEAGQAEWVTYPRCESTCKWITQPAQAEMLVVEDLSADQRFCNSCWVAQPPSMRFYASAPLVSSDRGLRYGTLCLVDFKPRHFSPQLYQTLSHMAEVVVRELEAANLVRWRQLALEEAESHVRRLVRGLDCFTEGIMLCDLGREGWPVEFANSALATLTGLPHQPPPGTPFWQLFQCVAGATAEASSSSKDGTGCSAGGSSACEGPCSCSSGSGDQMQVLLHAAQERRPFTATFRVRREWFGDSKSASMAGGGSSCAASRLSMQGSRQASLEGRWCSPGLEGRPSVDSQADAWSVMSAAGSVVCGDSSCSTTGAGGGTLAASPPAAAAAAAAAGFKVTFTPASSPDFLPDKPPIGIPAFATHASMTSRLGNSWASVGAAGDCYYFATVQPAAVPAAAGQGQQQGPASSTATLSREHSMDSGHSSRAVASFPLLRPANMKYVQLGPLLGVGASGRAYRGTWFGADVAVKIINHQEEGSRPSSTEPPECNATTGSFPGGVGGYRGGGGGAAPLLEAALSQALAHPHIVPTHAWGVSKESVRIDGKPHRQVWILQDLCTLGTLAHAVDRGVFRDQNDAAGTAGTSDACSLGPDVCAVLWTAAEVSAALAYMHAVGVLHGDLTGNNILLSPATKDGRGFSALVGDFGLSSLNSVPNPTDLRGSFGTVSHMPPELLSSDELSPATDSFALGVCLWEMMAGRRAWRGLGPFQIINAVTLQRRSLEVPPHWPEGIRSLITACLSFDPAARPTAQEVHEQVKALLAELCPWEKEDTDSEDDLAEWLTGEPES